MMDRRILFMGNPSSRSGKAAERISTALSRMQDRCWQVDFRETEPEGRTVDITRDAIRARNYDLVIYLGGDGTFSEVSKGIIESGHQVLLGVLPAGTANDQGKSFGISALPSDIEANLDIIEAEHTLLLDVGRVERISSAGEVDASNYVFHSIGWGIQPDILVQRNKDRRLIEDLPLLRWFYRDQAVYAGAIVNRYLASWREPMKFEAIAMVDDERVTLASLSDIVVNATAVYGGSWVLDQRSKPDDGLFEFIPLHGRRDWVQQTVKTLTPVVILNQQLNVFDYRRSSSRQFKRLELWLSRPENADIQSQLDGEEWVTGTHFRLEVEAKKLAVITPRDFVPPWRQIVPQEE
jgi:diacylglycerol kinase family enzyme